MERSYHWQGAEPGFAFGVSVEQPPGGWVRGQEQGLWDRDRVGNPRPKGVGGGEEDCLFQEREWETLV